MKKEVVDLENKKVGEFELPASIFGVDVKPEIISQMILWQLAKARQGSHSTKEIGDISGTTKKPWKQKGTGRARQGSLRSPQFRGGAVIFGPHVRSHEHDLPKKFRKLGLKMALSSKVQENKIILLDQAHLAESKTKSLVASLKKLGVQSALFVDGSQLDQNFALASRNLHKVSVLPQQGINVYDIVKHEYLIMTKNAVEQLGERLK